MRAVVCATLLIVLGLCFAGDPLVSLQLGNKKYTVNQKCIDNAVSVCTQDSSSQKAFNHFSRSAKDITDIKTKTKLWEPHHNKFSVKAEADIFYRSGAFKLPPNAKKEVRTQPLKTGRKLLQALPTDFDTRKQWPKCVTPIQNQGNCGSCWAFASSSVLSDRMCIATKGQIKGIFVSPQNAVSCSGTGSCNGGNPMYFFQYTNKTGIVASSCIGYKNSQYDGTNPTTCPITCDDGKTNTGQTTRYFTATAVQLKGRDVIKQEIMANGPVNMHMQTYADLMFYQRGIYNNVIKKPNGGHAVKCVGWGFDKISQTEYWIVANSWGASWGEDGYFRIKMGECETDDEVWAAQYTQTGSGPERVNAPVTQRPAVPVPQQSPWTTLPPVAYTQPIRKPWSTLPPYTTKKLVKK